MNEQLAQHLLEMAIAQGVSEFCLCPGARNAPLVSLLTKSSALKKHYWYEERSAAFFALGRSRASGKPVAVITTSGTAAAELLPATMEAYYTGVPLLLITADRPRHFRGTGAPQTAEQVGVLGRYVHFQEDLAQKEKCHLHMWQQQGPAHLNVCFDEPLQVPATSSIAWAKEIDAVSQRPLPPYIHSPSLSITAQAQPLHSFFSRTRCPFVVVGQLQEKEREPVVCFLQQLAFPVFLEAISGLREEPRLAHLRICRTDRLWTAAAKAGYPIDGILRIGGVPTFRLWRDLEDRRGQIAVCAISSLPFMGLSWGELIYTELNGFFSSLTSPQTDHCLDSSPWLTADRQYAGALVQLFEREPAAESSLIYGLSKIIPAESLVYLGNSLPIREWDLGATAEPRGLIPYASRGLNGIDGQISTFLGLSVPHRENWAVIGDLTALYDMAGPWILNQLPDHSVTIVIVNNGGGQIFSKIFQEKEFLHEHDLNFAPLAAMWGMEYMRWEEIPPALESNKNAKVRRLIEIVPDRAATEHFGKQLAEL